MLHSATGSAGVAAVSTYLRRCSLALRSYPPAGRDRVKGEGEIKIDNTTRAP